MKIQTTQEMWIQLLFTVLLHESVALGAWEVCQSHWEVTVVSFHLIAHFHTSHVSSLPTLPTLRLGPISDQCSKFIRTRKPITYPFIINFNQSLVASLSTRCSTPFLWGNKCSDGKDVSYQLGVGYRIKACKAYIHDGHLHCHSLSHR